MATIRDVVEALSRSNGVDAVVVVGRDGLPIDSRVANGVDAESVAAMLPSAIKQMAQLGDAGSRGDFTTAVLEFGRGLAIAGNSAWDSAGAPDPGQCAQRLRLLWAWPLLSCVPAWLV